MTFIGDDSLNAFIALSAILTIVVLVVVLRPLWRDSKGLALGCALMVAISAFALYWAVGTPAALDPRARAVPQTLGDVVAQLEAQLERDPERVDGWRKLGQAYTIERRFADASEAFAKAVALAPKNADLLVEAAKARAMATPQRRFDAGAVDLLQRALQAQPRHQRAQWFLGVAQRQAGDPAAAARTWQPLLAQVDVKVTTQLRAYIDSARKEAGLPPLPAAPSSAAATNVKVKVQLDPDLAARMRLDGDASVFVIARVPDGSLMPVAVEKHGVQELPFIATLDDSDSPMPTQKLSALLEVELIARLSASGNPTPQPGDIESRPQRVHLPVDRQVTLTIDAVHR